MKYMIAGLGSIGRRHLRNLVSLGEHDILLYRTFRSTLPEDEVSEFPVETDIRDALAHQPDAVIVSNPTALHLEVAIPAAQAGCHLLLEKPVSHSMHGVDQLQMALTTGGGKALVGFQFRFHPGLRRIRDLLGEGAIGHPVSVRAHWGEYLPGWHPWEDYRTAYSARSELGGGVILTLCHPLDYLRWLLGDAAAIWAFTGHLGDLEMDVEDSAEIGLRFTSGVIGSVHLDYIQRPSSHHLEIVGTQGTIDWDNATGAVSLYHTSSQGKPGEKIQPEIFTPPQGFERNELFRGLMEHFIAVVAGKQEPLCTLEDGIQALQLASAALESAKQGKLISLSQF
jgi:predicted dehydrogenase